MGEAYIVLRSAYYAVIPAEAGIYLLWQHSELTIEVVLVKDIISDMLCSRNVIRRCEVIS